MTSDVVSCPIHSPDDRPQKDKDSQKKLRTTLGGLLRLVFGSDGPYRRPVTAPSLSYYYLQKKEDHSSFPTSRILL